MTARPDTGQQDRGRIGRGPHVGTVLALVAAVPLLGMASVTWTGVRDARAQVATAAAVENLAKRAVQLAKLDSAIFDELVWSAVNAVAVTVADDPENPISPDEINSYLGIDVDARLASVMASTDQLLAAADVPGVADAVHEIRAAPPDLAEVLQSYDAIVALVEQPLNEVLQQLSVPDRSSAAAASVVTTVHALAIAVEARTTLAKLMYGSFTSKFDIRDSPAVEIARLIDLRHDYDSAIRTLTEAPSVPPRVRSAAGWLDTQKEVVAYRALLDDFIASSLADGVPDRGLDLALPGFSANLDQFTTMLAAMDGWAKPGMQLLDEAANAVLGAAESAEHDADADILRAYITASVLTAATLLAAVVAGRFIILPLGRLRRAANDLQTNREPTTAAAARGPSEVRAAAEAIGDAAAHIDLVTRQARALATGDLDAAVLDEQAPGGLGDALQDAVGVLRTALGQQEEFRRRLAHEAEHDGLTKLTNRNASMAKLHRSLARTHRSSTRLALLFIDLDHFKDVNDRHGHQAGDTVLAAIAQRLVTSVREGDHVGRLGGDEFIVIAEPVNDIDDAVHLAGRVLAALHEPILLPTTQVVVGASIGVAIADGAQLTADELLRDADLAVYRAKARGRGGIEVCDEDLRQELAEVADLTAAIGHAVQRDELVVHYQPIVDVASAQLHALEALVRWRRPGHEGLVMPSRFVDFAERGPLIVDVDRWVIDATIRQVAAWQDDPACRVVPVAVNVSGRHLAHDDFVAHVLGPLDRHRVDPRQIIVEVTESALLDDLVGAATKLQRLRGAGVAVSIDDFGTGYTSLAHLRSLPVDILKIDRSFTTSARSSPHDESIVKLIVDTGHLLGATVTAEGVETAAEADNLRRLGADHFQGYYFARPMPADDVVRSLVSG